MSTPLTSPAAAACRQGPRIRRVSHSEILGAVNASKLIDEYAAECSVPDYEPQAQIYAAMEQAGALQCFGAFANGELVGFASVLSGVAPHHGKRVATLESIFVSRAHRGSSAGNALLSAVERYAEELDCVAIVYQPRIGSVLEKVLMRRYKCMPTHTVFTRWLA